MVESQAVGRRKQAKGAPYPLIPRDSLKTPELYLQCWVLMHSVLWLSVYLLKSRLWGDGKQEVGRDVQLYSSEGGAQESNLQIFIFFMSMGLKIVL